MDEKEKNAGGTLTTNLPDLACYMQSVIGQLEADKKRSAVHTYTYALKSVTEFYGGEVFTPGRLKEYEEWMKLEGARKRSSGKEGAQKIDRGPKGLSLNTISTYMRDLKAVYNRLADEKVLAYNSKLFDDVYTKVESQTKRALEAEQMNTLLHTDIEELPGGVRYALAYFLLMFLFRGMPFIDLAYLRKQDVKGRCIVYSRHKTGRQMAVRIPKEAAGLMEEFRNMNPGSVYLFPILNEEDGREERSKRDEQGRKDGQGRDNGKVCEYSSS